MREKRANISDADVERVLMEGSIRAKAVASQKMTQVREKIGVTF